jgi:hypothetical protein
VAVPAVHHTSDVLDALLSLGLAHSVIQVVGFTLLRCGDTVSMAQICEVLQRTGVGVSDILHLRKKLTAIPIEPADVIAALVAVGVEPRTSAASVGSSPQAYLCMCVGLGLCARPRVSAVGSACAACL